MNPPLISVIMATFNEEVGWVSSAIESILNQSFVKFEFIIINDNPIRKDLDVLLNHFKEKDSRISLIKNKKNLGLAISLNIGLRQAKGKYIARMDADDISFSGRLEIQYTYMEANPSIHLVGAQCVFINIEGKPIGQSKNPLRFRTIKKVAPYINVASHPTWIFRKEIVEKVKGYRKITVEDYDFILRLISGGFKIKNLEKPLLYYRFRPESLTSVETLKRKISMKYAQQLYWDRMQGRADSFDENYEAQGLVKMPEKERRQQQYAQEQLQCFKKEKGMKRYFHLLNSIMASQIQRTYYMGYLKASLIRRILDF